MICLTDMTFCYRRAFLKNACDIFLFSPYHGNQNRNIHSLLNESNLDKPYVLFPFYGIQVMIKILIRLSFNGTWTAFEMKVSTSSSGTMELLHYKLW